MSVLNRENFMEAINTLLGDRTDEDTLNLVGDITDTYNSFDTGVEMIPKTELDRANSEWAKKYKERFFSPPAIDDKNGTEFGEEIDGNGKEKKKLTYDNLFTKGD